MSGSGGGVIMDAVRKHNLSGDPSQVGMDAILAIDKNNTNGTPYSEETASSKSTTAENNTDAKIDEKAGEKAQIEACIGPCSEQIQVLGKKQNAWFLACLMCDGKLCNKCSGVKKTEVNSMNTANDKVVCGNVGWVCDHCMLGKTNPSKSQKNDQDIKSDLMVANYENLKGEIDLLKQQVSEVVNGVNDISQNMQINLRSVLNETLFGDDFPEFDPAISHTQAKRIAKEQNKPAPPTLHTIISNAAVEQKHADKKEDTEKAIARCNVIIYGMDEPTESDGEVRKAETNAKIEELLGFLEVEGIHG